MGDGAPAPPDTPARAVRPKAAASLILLDRTGPVPRVLMGRRNAMLRFMPGKFVFPGGRVEADDDAITPLDTLTEPDATRLARKNHRAAPAPQSFALAAVRETFEEAGLVIGAKTAPNGKPVPNAWRAFVNLGFLPRIGQLAFLARAVTPPHLPRRFDTRFFIAEAAAVAHRIEGVAHADAELVELAWLSIDEALQHDVGTITGTILQEVSRRAATGRAPDGPVPFFRYRNRRFLRDTL